MPYPNYGAHCMAVNDGEGQENCQYTGVTYMGFPYIFLIATANIKEGTELLTSYGDDYFKNRGHCECRIPGEREREKERTPLQSLFLLSRTHTHTHTHTYTHTTRKKKNCCPPNKTSPIGLDQLT
jgi:hypothetical protein